LLKLDQEVAEYVREAKRRDALGPDELVSTVVDAVARGYFRHILRKQARVTPLRSRTRSWKTTMDNARYIPPHRWRDRTPRRRPPSWSRWLCLF
jgi:hypothetical protein